MGNKYEKPAITTLEDVQFETVCAGSGLTCSHGKTAVDAYDSQCQACMKLSNPNLVGPYQDTPAEWASAITDWLTRKNHVCPEGYNLDGKVG